MIDSLGTHNTLDGAAPGTDFAQVILFTEAIPTKLRNELEDTHRLYACHQQRDLVIAVHVDLDLENVKLHYRLVHKGVEKVTPHRGIFWITATLNGERVALMVEHRINAAFPPYKRGEAKYRRRKWRKHTRIALRIIRRLKRRGFEVYAGGDLNTIRGVLGYRGVLNEYGRSLDRLGSTRRLHDLAVLDPVGSDHHRLVARDRKDKK